MIPSGFWLRLKSDSLVKFSILERSSPRIKEEILIRDIHYLLVSNFNLLLTSVKLITLEGNCLSFKLVQPSPSQFTVAVPSGHWHLPSVQTSALITEPKTRAD